MQEYSMLCIVLGLGFVIGACAGLAIGKNCSSSKHRKEMARAQRRIDVAINKRVDHGDIWLCESRGVYHLRDGCSLAGNRTAPMIKKTLCKGCMKDSIMKGH
jgi:hypothetical protein